MVELRHPGDHHGKMDHAAQGLGGAFFGKLSGDTSNDELISAMAR